MSPTYKVTIPEIHHRVVSVVAEDEDDAIHKVEAGEGRVLIRYHSFDDDIETWRASMDDEDPENWFMDSCCRPSYEESAAERRERLRAQAQQMAFLLRDNDKKRRIG